MSKKTKKIMYIRSGALNTTPAVEKYLDVNRSMFANWERIGVEWQHHKKKRTKKVDRLYSFNLEYSTSAQRIAGIIRWQKFIARCIKKEKPSVIQFCDVFSSLMPTVNKLFDIRQVNVFDIRDNIAPSIKHKSAIAASLLGSLEKVVCMISDKVVIVDPAREVFLPHNIKGKLREIPNAPLIDSYRGTKIGCDPIVINLSGWISEKRNLENWLSLSFTHRRKMRIETFGTPADEKTRLKMKEAGIVKIESLCKEEYLRKMESSTYVALMYDTVVEINQYAAPNKYVEALMMGRPVICSEGMKLSEEVRNSGSGHVIRYGDFEQLERKILSTSKREIEKMSLCARRLFENKYLGVVEGRMKSLYREVEKDLERMSR